MRHDPYLLLTLERQQLCRKAGQGCGSGQATKQRIHARVVGANGGACLACHHMRVECGVFGGAEVTWSSGDGICPRGAGRIDRR